MSIPAPLSFAERDRRWQLAREIMKNNNLDTLIIYGDRESAAPAPFASITTLQMIVWAQL